MMAHGHTLTVLSVELAVCRLDPSAVVPEWAWYGSFVSLTRTREELSVVCEVDAVPPDAHCVRGWRVLRVEGPLPFEMVGVLASLTTTLAQAGVSVFAISTYDTDYLLVRLVELPRAIAALRQAGHRLAHEG